MSARLALVISLTLAVAVGACSVLNGYEPVEAGGGGAGDGGASTGPGGASGTGASGAGGELPTCNDAACQAGSGDCTSCTCLQGLVCDCDPVPRGTPCPNGICTGVGVCVDCLDTIDCPMGFVCDQNQCVDGGCADDAKNNQETDVDCGGVDCAPCVNGKICLVPEDCASIHCDGGLCDACTQQVDCGTALYCNIAAGACTQQKEAFMTCSQPYECLSGSCDEIMGLKFCAQ